MGASSSRPSRWLWPVLLLVILAVVLAAGRNARASSAREEAAPAANTAYLPTIRTEAGPQLEFAPFMHNLPPTFDDAGQPIIFDTITDITHAGDQRLFVALRQGFVFIVNPNGSVNPHPFLDLEDEVVYEANWEQGLLGLAFHPNYPAAPYVYVAYNTTRLLVVARLTVNQDSPNQVDRASLRRMISVTKPRDSVGYSPVHNGGDLAFGPDGYLYIPLGDGGPDPYDPRGVPGDPNNNAQRRESLLGSILRIDPNPTRGLRVDCGLTSDDPLYSIPSDNPWLGDSGCDELWAKGLRNPWRVAIDSLTGNVFIADVGEWLREEVSFYPGGGPGGANFGWHCYEGTVNYTTIHNGLAAECQNAGPFTPPIYDYDHSDGGCSVIGGAVYRGQKYPTLYGRYFFGDFCTRQYRTTFRQGNQWKTQAAGIAPTSLTTFGADVNGELYAGDFQLAGAPVNLYKVIVR